MNHAFSCVLVSSSYNALVGNLEGTQEAHALDCTSNNSLFSFVPSTFSFNMHFTVAYIQRTEANLANLPGCCQLGWTQDWLCIFVSVPVPQHSVLTACESGLYDED